MIEVTPRMKLPPYLQHCLGDTTALDASSPVLPATYLWRSLDGHPFLGERNEAIIRMYRTGRYQVTVKVAQCEYTDTVMVEFKAPPIIKTDNEGIANICEFDQGVLLEVHPNPEIVRYIFNDAQGRVLQEGT